MSISATPTGEKGRKELKVTTSDENLFEKFFEDYIEESKETGVYYQLDCAIFDVPKVSIRGIETAEGKSRDIISNPENHVSFKGYNVETNKGMYNRFKEASERAKKAGMIRREQKDQNKEEER